MAKNESLMQRMNNKVIPLLLEYYMNDEKEVRNMLGEKELKALLLAEGLMLEEKSWPLRITAINA
jgi:5-methylcytosine-specific restriction protein B